jgi:IS30 family transposase
MGKQYEHLSLDERCRIARLHEDGQSIRQIAAALDRPPSTVSRELRRNRGKQVGYKPSYAHEQAKARRWTGSRLERDGELRRLVLDRLRHGWSPEQIAGRLACDKAATGISHESIYRFIYAQIRRTNAGSWRHYLPRAKAKRGWRGRKGGSAASSIKGRVSIAQRPEAANGRAFPGHWEADLMLFKTYGQAILVAHERVSRILILARQPNKAAEPTARQLIAWLEPLPPELRQTITFDPQPLAKGRDRERNRTHAPAPATQNRSRRHPSQNPQCRRRRLQQYPTKMPGLPNPSRGIPGSTVALQM